MPATATAGRSGCRQSGPCTAALLGREYPFGLRRVAGSSAWVYTNRGLGTTVLLLCLFCPPEVSLLTLRSVTGD